MQPLANINGEILPLADAKISALDRGFLLGDAVYEVLRVYQGKPWLEAEHFARLQASLRAIRILGVDEGRLRQRMHDTIAAGPFSEATVYLQITRGSAPRKHAFPSGAKPLEFLYVQEFKDPYTLARQSGGGVVTRPDIRWDRCDIKSTNLLANVLAMQVAAEAKCVEALFFLPDGTLTEGTHTSFFAVKDQQIWTRPSGHDILPGITRHLIMTLAKKAGLKVQERAVRMEDLPQLHELFLTGTTAEVLPIVRVNQATIGKGVPGPVTRKLQQVYADAVKDFVKG
jgi:D-alanine transaminase